MNTHEAIIKLYQVPEIKLSELPSVTFYPMKTRTDVINHLVDKYHLKRYLEIGVQVPELNFDKINCEYKVGVDPDPKANASFCMTSDEFFESYTEFGFIPFDIVFIDGLHTAEQVKKDFENALKILSPNGFIVLHDCNPLKEEYTIVPRPTERGHWNGDVYRFALILCCETFTDERAITIDTDNGITIFKSNTKYRSPGYDIPFVSWQYFDTHRKGLLNLISFDEFTKM